MKTHLHNEIWLYRNVVVMLGLTMVPSMIGAIVLLRSGQPTPEVIVALGLAAIGGLAGLLAPSPLNR
jgi:hypothetical protein